MELEPEVHMKQHVMLQQLVLSFMQQIEITLPQQLERKLEKRRKRNAARSRKRHREMLEKEDNEKEEKRKVEVRKRETLQRLKLEKEALKMKFEETRGSVRKQRFVHHSKEQLHQLISAKLEAGLAVRVVEGKGRSVFATRFFNEGEFVCQYLGEYLTLKEGKEREAEYKEDPSIGSFMFFVGQGRNTICIDATAESPGMGRLISHSRLLPNLQSKAETIDGVQHVYFKASEDIFPGEELKYDYGENRKEILDDLYWFEES